MAARKYHRERLDCAGLLSRCGYEFIERGFSFEDFRPCKLLFAYRLLADIPRRIPLAGSGDIAALLAAAGEEHAP